MNESLSPSRQPGTLADNIIGDILLGTDLVYLPRLERAYQHHGLAFFARVLTETELAYCTRNHPEKGPSHQKNFIQRAGSRIAVKEAVSKALGIGVNGFGWPQGLPWQSIETLSIPQMPPALKLYGKALNLAKRQTVQAWRISFSHDGDYATATVLGLKGLSETRSE